VSGKQKGPTSLREALDGYLKGSGLADRVEEASVVPDWEERVGAAIAAVTTPTRVNNGTLLVHVRSSAWLTELKLMESEILRRVNAGRKKGRIQKIRFLMSA
jgi:predicted nucleic acid-binding Zn ribbon protein